MLLPNFKDVYQYIIGNTRYFLYKLNPKFIRLHIREQVGWRQSACSPVCKYESRCCGCKAPNVFFAPKGCGNGNYPKLMGKAEWLAYNQLYDYIMKSYLDYTKVDNIYPFDPNIFYVNQLSHEKIVEMYEDATINARSVLMEPESIEIVPAEFEDNTYKLKD